MSLPGDPPTLPLPLTRFFGRSLEIATAADRLRSGQARLLTLIGPGGVGKTRLALQIAADVEERFAHGVHFVPLSAVRDPALVLPTLVVALGIESDEGAEPAARLQTYLRQRQTLLVLDNLEQVIAVGAALGELLVACPRLSLLVTSRLPLRTSGEHLFPIAPFPVPDVRNDTNGDHMSLVAADAIALFADRAMAARPTFALTADNMSHVVAICRQSEGLPLAIELAAARLRVLSPGELATRLDRRMPLLAGGPRDLPDRLRTMRDAIAWSHDLLEPAQRTLFRWLSVYVGGFSFSAVEQMASTLRDSVDGVAVDLLSGLIDANLVQRFDSPVGDSRFTMLETIREFGLEQLIAEGEDVAARDAHASWCVTFAEAAGPNLTGPDHLAWWSRIEAELGNIRAAHTWLFGRHDAERALHLGVALAWFWSVAGFFAEGRALFRQLIAMPEVKCYPLLLARAFNAAGNLEHWLGQLDDAELLYKRQLGLSRKLADPAGIAVALRSLGSLAVDRNDVDRASRLLTEGLSLAPRAHAAWDAAAIANLLGIVDFARGEYERAARRSEEAIAGWRALDDTGHVAAAQVNFARALLALGNSQQAAERLCAVLDVVQAEVGDDWVTSDCFDVAGGIAVMAHDVTSGVQLLASADAMLARMDVERRPCFQAFADRLIADARLRLGSATIAAASRSGAALPVPEAIELAEAVANAVRSGQPAVKASATGLAALTAREREVLRLVAAGRSDKEIAAVLGITRFTASNHVAKIRAKLDAPSRAAVAALVARDRLL